MSRSHLVYTALVVIAAAPAGESFVTPVVAPGQASPEPLVVTRNNITAQREQAGGTSSYYDLRLGDGGIIGGVPIAWPHALLTVGVRQREIFRDENSIVIQPPGSPFALGAETAVEQRTEYTVCYRQGLWTPWAWDAELEVQMGITAQSVEVHSVVGGTYSDANLLQDPRVILRLPLWQERYAGLLLGIGWSMGVDDTVDWIDAHGGAGGIVSLAWSGPIHGLDLVSARAMVEYTMVPNSEQRIYTTGQTASSSYSGLLAGGGIDWRLTRRFSIGATATYEQHDWQNLTVEGLDTGSEQIVTSAVGGYGRIQWPNRWFTTLNLSGEALTNAEQDRSISATISLSGTPW